MEQINVEMLEIMSKAITPELKKANNGNKSAISRSRKGLLHLQKWCKQQRADLIQLQKSLEIKPKKKPEKFQ